MKKHIILVIMLLLNTGLQSKDIEKDVLVKLKVKLNEFYVNIDSVKICIMFGDSGNIKLQYIQPENGYIKISEAISKEDICTIFAKLPNNRIIAWMEVSPKLLLKYKCLELGILDYPDYDLPAGYDIVGNHFVMHYSTYICDREVTSMNTFIYRDFEDYRISMQKAMKYFRIYE